MSGKLALRVNAANPNHHLWSNNGTWWCHLTVHLPDYTKRRLRLSLETGDIQHARQLRDRLFARLAWGVPWPTQLRHNVAKPQGSEVAA